MNDNRAIKILLVEDNRGDVRLVQAMLARAKGAHFDMDHVSRLSDALDYLSAERADVVLLDLSLPDSRGYQTFSAVSSLAPEVPIVLLTATDDESLAIQAASEGAQDYLVKGQVESRGLARALRYAIERKRVQRQLRLQSKALEAAANAIVITDLDGTVVWVNPAFTGLTGYALDEAVGHNLRLLNSGQHESLFFKHLWDTILTGKVWHGEIVNRHKDGHTYIEEMTITPVHDERGEIINFIAIKQDITPRKQMEVARERAREALQRRYRELSLLNRVITKAASTLDVEEVLQVVCQELAAIFDLPYASSVLIDAEGQRATVATEYFDFDTDTHILNQAFEVSENVILTQVLEYKEPLLIEDIAFDGRVSDIRPLLVDWGIVVLLVLPVVVRGRVISTIVLGSREPRDFHEDELALAQAAVASAGQALEAAELYQTLQQYTDELEGLVAQRTAELSDALERAQDADRAKSQFLSNVSHELRTPLTNIKLYLSLLRRGRENKRDMYMETLSREAERLQKLIEDLLDVSRLDLGKIKANLKLMDLNQLIETLVLDRRKLFEDRQLSLQIVKEAEFPPLRLDAKLFEQILTNLLTNALNYTPPGGTVTLRTWRSEGEGHEWAMISVQDTGPGISKEEQAHLFERFYRGQAGRTTNVPGAGLGLTICKEIVDLHQGQMTLESTEGQGATFTIWLPVPEAQAMGGGADACISDL